MVYLVMLEVFIAEMVLLSGVVYHRLKDVL